VGRDILSGTELAFSGMET